MFLIPVLDFPIEHLTGFADDKLFAFQLRLTLGACMVMKSIRYHRNLECGFTIHYNYGTDSLKTSVHGKSIRKREHSSAGTFSVKESNLMRA